MAFDDKHDDQTPKPRVMFAKPGFRGSWYQDVEGRDRCPAEWVGPCPYLPRQEGRRPGARRALRTLWVLGGGRVRACDACADEKMGKVKTKTAAEAEKASE